MSDAASCKRHGRAASCRGKTPRDPRNTLARPPAPISGSPLPASINPIPSLNRRLAAKNQRGTGKFARDTPSRRHATDLLATYFPARRWLLLLIRPIHRKHRPLLRQWVQGANGARDPETTYAFCRLFPTRGRLTSPRFFHIQSFALSLQSSPPLRDSSYQSRHCWNLLPNGVSKR